MKLKSVFCTQPVADGQIMVAVDEKVANFRGIVRSNETAAFVVDLLAEDTTREEILDKLMKTYDGSKDKMERDLDMVISKLRSIGAIED